MPTDYPGLDPEIVDLLHKVRRLGEDDYDAISKASTVASELLTKHGVTVESREEQLERAIHALRVDNTKLTQRNSQLDQENKRLAKMNQQRGATINKQHAEIAKLKAEQAIRVISGNDEQIERLRQVIEAMQIPAEVEIVVKEAGDARTS